MGLLQFLFGDFKAKPVAPPKHEPEEWVTRHKKRARDYEITHARGTRVAAEHEDGTWKEGQIVGDHDWQLFTFLFTVKFDDGTIRKLEEGKVTRL